MKLWVQCLTRLHLSFLTCKLISATPTTLNFDERIKWDDQVSSYGVEHIGRAHTWQQSLADREAVVSSGSTATSEALDRFMNANLTGIDLHYRAWGSIRVFGTGTSMPKPGLWGLDPAGWGVDWGSGTWRPVQRSLELSSGDCSHQRFLPDAY